MAEPRYGQRELEQSIAAQNAAIAAKEKAEREKREAEQKRIEEKRRRWSVYREWITISLSLAGTILSIISLLWQAPLH